MQEEDANELQLSGYLGVAFFLTWIQRNWDRTAIPQCLAARVHGRPVQSRRLLRVDQPRTNGMLQTVGHWKAELRIQTRGSQC